MREIQATGIAAKTKIMRMARNKQRGNKHSIDVAAALQKRGCNHARLQQAELNCLWGHLKTDNVVRLGDPGKRTPTRCARCVKLTASEHIVFIATKKRTYADVLILGGPCIACSSNFHGSVTTEA